MNSVKIECVNLKKKNKDNVLYFKQIKDDKTTQIIIKNSGEIGYISFNFKSKYKIKIKNKILLNGYINIKIKDKLVIDFINKIDNHIVINQIDFFAITEYNNFDFDTYRNNYEDLKNISNKYFLWCHWCQFGKKEERTYNNKIICNENKNILMILNGNFGESCGGTKTALNFLYQISKLGYKTNILFLFSNKQTIYNYNKIKNTNCNNTLYFNINDINFEIFCVISTLYITTFYSTLIKSSYSIYFIQDYEPFFFDNDILNKYLALCSYKINLKHIILGFDFIKSNIIDKKNDAEYINICANNNIYYNKLSIKKKISKLNESNYNILIVYYINKPRRSPKLIYELTLALTKKYPNFNYSCFPDNINIDNVKYFGYMNEKELNDIYNKNDISICFSDTNISRLTYEMMITNLLVIDLDNSNNLDRNYFELVKPNINAIMLVFDKIINDKSYFIQKINYIDKNKHKYYIQNENLNFQKAFNKIITYKMNKKQQLYVLLSNGNLGSDIIKGYILFEKIKHKYDIIFIPTDINFNYNENITDLIINIKNSIIIIIRSMIILHSNIIELLYNNNNIIIYDHVDLFIEDIVLKKIISMQQYFNIILCNNKEMKNKLQKYFDNDKLLVIYHIWDPRYLTINSKYNFDNGISLGFIGCVKNIDNMLLLHNIIIKKYNVKLLDSECWEYVNDKYENNDYNWATKHIDFVNLDINFNVHLSIRNENSYFKTNTKISTAACLDHIIITTKEASNVELLGHEYPFYLNEITLKEFERIYNLLITDFNTNKILFNKARTILNKIKIMTNINNISNIYIKLFDKLSGNIENNI